MTMHRAHPLTDPEQCRRFGVSRPDPADAILFDECDRCAEHAANPLAGLSGDHLAGMWAEMAAVEHGRGGRDHYRTKAEARAGRALYQVAVFLERHTTLDPWTWPLDVDAAARNDALRRAVTGQ